MKIVIWTGPAWETWGPESMETGIGGSELAAMHVAAGLAGRGHAVEIVGQVHPGTWRGVTFSDHRVYEELDRATGWKTTKTIECDAFISSRSLPALRFLKPRCRLSALWMHDVHVGSDAQGLMREFDIILTLSEWARVTAMRYYPGAKPERFVVTRNGIDTGLFIGPPVKVGCKAIYSSSPDRGLDKLLDWWPAIRKLRPDAELHVYYGFDTWEKMAEVRRDKIARLQIEIYRTRLARMAEQGVVSHGRVGQWELAQAWKGASLWLYPTSFSETSCITAMEAQAAGAWPITSNLAALRETVRRGVLIDPPNTRNGYREEFLEHVRSFLEDDDPDRDKRQMFNRIEALEKLDWRGVAEQWERLFSERMRG